MVICLERGADLHTTQLMPLPLTISCSSKIQIGLPLWFRLTLVALDKGPLNGCVCGGEHATEWASLSHLPISLEVGSHLP